MLQYYSRYRILQEFFDFPRKSFQLRELSRNVSLAQVSVMNHVRKLVKEGLIVREEKGIYPSYRANRENEEFKLLKKQNIILRLHKTGFIKHVDEKIKPNCIVLFGSAARGEDTENSDLDIFIQAAAVDLKLGEYEKLLKRKISILLDHNLKEMSKELLNNIINGEILYGYLKVF